MWTSVVVAIVRLPEFNKDLVFGFLWIGTNIAISEPGRVSFGVSAFSSCVHKFSHIIVFLVSEYASSEKGIGVHAAGLWKGSRWLLSYCYFPTYSLVRRLTYQPYQGNYGE